MKYWFILLMAALVFVGCAPVRSKNTYEKMYELDPGADIFVSPILKENPPRRVAILPFVSSIGSGRLQGSRTMFNVFNGHGGEIKLAQRMREAFYGQFAQLDFDELKLFRIDQTLAENELKTPGDIAAVSPKRLGEILGADAVVYGEVTQFDYYYGILYAQLAAGLSLKMVDTRDGNLLWRAQDARRDHCIRIALDPVGLAVGVFQVGLHVRPISMMRAMDEACRELVGTIPPPRFSPEKS